MKGFAFTFDKKNEEGGGRGMNSFLSESTIKLENTQKKIAESVINNESTVATMM